MRLQNLKPLFNEKTNRYTPQAMHDSCEVTNNLLEIIAIRDEATFTLPIKSSSKQYWQALMQRKKKERNKETNRSVHF